MARSADIMDRWGTFAGCGDYHNALSEEAIVLVNMFASD